MEQKHKGKILWISDSPFTTTGFSSQSLFLLNGLAEKGWDCHYQAHNYPGQTLPEGCVKLADGTPFNFTLYGNGREPYSKDILEPRIKELKPDFFIVLLDTFMLFDWYLKQNYAPAHTLFWYPSDGGYFPTNCEHILMKCEHPVAMSKYAQKQMLEQYNIKTDHIPHAVNHKQFFPLSKDEKEEIKRKYGLSNKFVIGLMGRNQGRKMHDRAIKMFAQWCKKYLHEDVVLFIHADSMDVAAVFDMSLLIQRLNLQNKVRFSGMKYYNGVTYEEMNNIYNVMDIYISATSGEGFGIGTIEAMSCEVPVLNTAYTTTDELVVNNNAGEAIKLVGSDLKNVMEMNINDYENEMLNGTLTGSWSVERGLVDINDGAEKIEKLFNDKSLRELYGKNGRKAVLENYTWDIVIDKWDKLLTSIKNG